jgi:starvation-inducible DNA-binding protein
MKTTDYNQINPVYAKSAIINFQKLLADIQILYSNIRGFHWNVKGKYFYELHEKFEKVYDDLNEKADEVAERILMLGGIPESKFSEYIKIAEIKESPLVTDGNEMISYLIEAYGKLVKTEKKIISEASLADDEVTISLLSDYLKEQEKEIWMLLAYNS